MILDNKIKKGKNLKNNSEDQNYVDIKFVIWLCWIFFQEVGVGHP